MQEILENFFRTITSQLKLICEGKYEATDEVLKFSDPTQNDSNISELAETVGLLSVKLEAREMALEKKIDELRESISEKRRFSVFFIFFTFFIVVFCFVSAYLNQSSLTQQELDVISPIVCLGFLFFLIIISVIYILIHRFSFFSFGLTFRGSKRAITESLVATLPCIALITLARYWCDVHTTIFEGRPFIDISLFSNSFFWIYVFVAIGQEFVARGVVQSVILQLLTGRYSRLLSVVLASLIFASTHTYFSFWISILSVAGGFFWGWLYLRHQTIVGVSISHFMVGNYLWLTGFWNLLM